MRFTEKDGILFGVLCIAFGIYSVFNRGGLSLSGAGLGDVSAIVVGVLVLAVSLFLLFRKKKRH